MIKQEKFLYIAITAVLIFGITYFGLNVLKKEPTIILTGNCSEIIEYTAQDETAVCNLASIALPSYVNQKERTFDFKKLREVVKVAIRNLNRVIDINYYPTPETKKSNSRHRPVGLGI